MSSCAASCCTCCHVASSASATSASSPTANEPRCCRSASDLLQNSEHRSTLFLHPPRRPDRRPLPRCPLCGGAMHVIERTHTRPTAASLSTPHRQACRMNPQLQPRTGPMLRMAARTAPPVIFTATALKPTTHLAIMPKRVLPSRLLFKPDSQHRNPGTRLSETSPTR